MKIEADCNDCVHKKVCRYSGSYLRLIREVENMSVHLEESCVSTPLSGVEFITDPIIRCKYHRRSQ